MIRYWCVLLFGIAAVSGQPVSGIAATVTRLFTVQMTARGEDTQVTIDLGRPMSFHTMIDSRDGGRILIDFDDVTLMPDKTMARGVGLIRGYHAESLNGRAVRLVLDLAHPAVIGATQSLVPAAGKPARAIIVLNSSSAIAMKAAENVGGARSAERTRTPALADDAIAALIAPDGLAAPSPQKQVAVASAPSGSPRTPKTVRAAEMLSPLPLLSSRPKTAPSITSIISPKQTIVIDAGHGGIDPGAESVAGYHEKEITLATARLLRRALEATGRYKVVMTRDSDVYLKLHERVARARAAHGNLFISLHADSVQPSSDRTTRGASIYTLSETASDAESERYAQQENRADAIGGVDLGDQSDDVAGILVDLTVRETVNDGNRFAGMMVESLTNQGVALLPNMPHRSAGFAVLKSPDIPSVLIEMGYLSDISDARALADPRHQLQIANAITAGVQRYFAWLQVSRS